MRKNITKITDSDFDSLVLFPRKPAVVFFSADWSESSQTVCPFFEAAAEKYKSKVTIYEMDADENPIIPIAYRVRRIPAVLMFAGGRLSESHFGMIAEEMLDEKIEKLTASGEIYQTIAAFSKKLAARARYRVGWLLSELL
jgi:thioredoxin-like negative regulator of GroEL